MKSVATKIKAKELPYPKLMKNKVTDLVVLFTAQGVGMSIYKGNSLNGFLGEYSKNWSCEQFEDYTGEVTLSN